MSRNPEKILYKLKNFIECVLNKPQKCVFSSCPISSTPQIPWYEIKTFWIFVGVIFFCKQLTNTSSFHAHA